MSTVHTVFNMPVQASDDYARRVRDAEAYRQVRTPTAVESVSHATSVSDLAVSQVDRLMGTHLRLLIAEFPEFSAEEMGRRVDVLKEWKGDDPMGKVIAAYLEDRAYANANIVGMTVG